MRILALAVLLLGCTAGPPVEKISTITTARPSAAPTTQAPLVGLDAIRAATPDPNMDVRIVISASQYGILQARVTVVGFLNTTCAASAVLPSGNRSAAQGLEARHTVTTGERLLSWTYAKSGATQTGRGEHTVSCTRGVRPPAVAVEPFAVP